MGKPIDIIGQRYGKLLVVEIDHIGDRGRRYWKCVCDCGNSTVQMAAELKSGKVASCGCERYKKLKERNTKHGKSKTRIYKIWRSMISRCRYKSATGYENYGGRGIVVCPEWQNFDAFYEWAISAGYAEDLTIERNDVNGNYCPENCSWIPWAAQAKNKRERSTMPARDPITGRFRAIHDNPELLEV